MYGVFHGNCVAEGFKILLFYFADKYSETWSLCTLLKVIQLVCRAFSFCPLYETQSLCVLCVRFFPLLCSIMLAGDLTFKFYFTFPSC